MRRFTIYSGNSQSDSQSDSRLENWIHSRCRRLGQEYEVDFEFDFATEAQGMACCPALLTTLDDVLTQASRASQSGSTIDVGTYWTRRGLEIEVSTNNDCAQNELLSAFRKESSSVGNGFSLSVYRARCPQGGTAWIIVQSHFARLRMVA